MQKESTYTSKTKVTSANTAIALGSGDMEVFATPALVALMENAAMNAAKDQLPEGSTTVGAFIETTHVKPSPLGEEVSATEVSATAVLEKEEGRKLTFRITASDTKGTVGEATHIRYIVDRERFMSKL